jgi:hypothetical protein
MIPVDATAIAAGGTYYRDRAGTWRYAASGEPVPGAEDMTPSNLYALRVVRTGSGEYVEVPRAPACREPELRWTLAYRTPVQRAHDDLGSEDPDTGEGVLRVPPGAWREHDAVIGLWAPELAARERGAR